MKILEVAGSGGIGNRHMGPVTNVVQQLCSEFQKMGHEVTVVDSKNIDTRESFPSNVRLIEIGNESRHIYLKRKRRGKNFRNSVRKWNFNRKFVHNLKKTLDLYKYDIIHTHEAYQTVLLRSAVGKGLVYTVHTPQKWIDEQGKSRQHWLDKAKMRLLGKAGMHDLPAIKASDLTITLGQYVLDNLKKSNPEIVKNSQIITIPNGANIGEFKAVDRMSARELLAIDKNAFVMVSIGRLHRQKGQDILVKAIKSLKKDIPNMRVYIIGSVNQKERDSSGFATMLVEMAKSLPITFTGFVSNRSQEFFNFLSASDLSIIPSIIDNQPTVVMESLAMDLPVIASNTGGIPQMVPENVGRLFKPGDYRELSEHILFLHRNREILNSMKRESRKTAEENFSWKKSAERHVQIFNMLITNSLESSLASLSCKAYKQSI